MDFLKFSEKQERPGTKVGKRISDQPVQAPVILPQWEDELRRARFTRQRRRFHGEYVILDRKVLIPRVHLRLSGNGVNRLKADSEPANVRQILRCLTHAANTLDVGRSEW